jgi:hypothetical protein
MATALNNSGHVPPPIWRGIPVPVIAGLGDTRRNAGTPYAVRPLGEIFQAKACRLPKEQAPAFLPSTYAESDARAHEAQRERGSFVALVGDVDEGDHPLSRVRELVESFANGSAWMIYSTASAMPSEKRWRVVLPLDGPVSFTMWYDAQLALTAHMVAGGVEMDTCAARPGQVSFLPNVPSEMCDEAGEPVFYQQASSASDAAGLQLHTGPVADGIEAIGRKRKADDAEREQIRQEAERRRQARPTPSDDASVIDTFNRSNSVENLLALYEYDQSPRDRRDWRSRYQTSGTFATRVLDGGKWVSLSGSDASAGVGAQCSTGCYGDAYDLFVHYDHGGDRRAAWKAACEEQGRTRPRQSNERRHRDEGQSWQGNAANDRGADEREAAGEANQKRAEASIKATPFQWRDPATIPPRKWLYGRHLIRKFLSLDIAPGGLGKSSVKIVESLAMTTGQPLLGKDVHEGPLRVWLYNLEDPAEETERRIHAAMQRYDIGPEDLGGRLFVDSGRDQPICIAEETPDGAKIMYPVTEAVIAELLERKIDVLSIDPFVSSHAISENDNQAIDMVAKEWSRIADICNCSINLVHHVRKSNGAEVTAESSRGAVSLIGAARSVIVYNRMTKEEATDASIKPVERGFYFRMHNDKANLAPPEAADWIRMNNVDLPNGDSVGVACPWEWPDAFDGIDLRHLYAVQLAVDDGEWRESIQAKDWVGHAIAQALQLDVSNDKGRIKNLLRTWVGNGALKVDKRRTDKSRDTPFIVVGSWVDPSHLPTS